MNYNEYEIKDINQRTLSSALFCEPKKVLYTYSRIGQGFEQEIELTITYSNYDYSFGKVENISIEVLPNISSRPTTIESVIMDLEPILRDIHEFKEELLKQPSETQLRNFNKNYTVIVTETSIKEAISKGVFRIDENDQIRLVEDAPNVNEHLPKTSYQIKSKNSIPQTPESAELVFNTQNALLEYIWKNF